MNYCSSNNGQLFKHVYVMGFFLSVHVCTTYFDSWLFFSFIKCDYCPASAPTVSVVSKCPTNKTEWDQAASRKKCSHMSAKCGDKSPVYHCLLNQWGNETVEVCASTWYISGNEVARSLMFMTCLSCSQSSSFESTTSL